MQDPIELVDTWSVGDTLKDFEFTAYKRDGSLFDFTGYSGVLVGRSRDNRANTLNVACGFNAPATDGIARVPSLGTALTLTPGRTRAEVYACQFVWTRISDSKKLKSRKFALAIEPDAAAV
jgi:hypothetical protein